MQIMDDTNSQQENNGNQFPFLDNHILTVINKLLKKTEESAASNPENQKNIDEILNETEKWRKEEKRVLLERRRKKTVNFLETLRSQVAEMDYDEQLKVLKQKQYKLNLDLIEFRLKGRQEEVISTDEIIKGIIIPLIQSISGITGPEKPGSTKRKSKLKTSKDRSIEIPEVKLKWDPKLDDAKISEIAECLIGIRRFNKIDLHKLTLLLYGEKVKDQLIWYGPANSLITVFYDLHYYHYLAMRKNQIEKFFNQCLLYSDNGEIKEFNIAYIKVVMTPGKKEKRTNRTNKYYIDILSLVGLKMA